jgi:plastocyanin
MADYSVDIVSGGFQPDPLNVTAGSLVSWNNTTGANCQITAPAQGGVAAFQTTLTLPGMSTTPEYYIPSNAAAGTEYAYSDVISGATGTIVVVDVKVIPDI